MSRPCSLLFVVIPKPVIGPPVYAVELVAAPLPTTHEARGARSGDAPAGTGAACRGAGPCAGTRQADQGRSGEAEGEGGASAAPTKAVQAPEKPVEKTPVTKSETQPLPGETPSTGTDVANIKIPGIEFPYPEYLRNIMNEVLRRWNAPTTGFAPRSRSSSSRTVR